MGTWVDPQTWYARLASFYATTAALITNEAAEVLLVKPNYRNHWAFPGGYVDAGEFPQEACARELHEELGLMLPIGALLVVDWAAPAGERPRALVSLTFDAGILTASGQINLNSDELDELAFLAAGEAADRLPSAVAPRVDAALRARRHGAVYLPNEHIA